MNTAMKILVLAILSFFIGCSGEPVPENVSERSDPLMNGAPYPG